MYATIMVPLDGSTFAERALPLATLFARRTGADVHLVTVLEPFASFTGSDWEAATRTWGETYLKEVAGRVAESVDGKVTFALLHGRAAEALSAEANKVEADLTVMATHGRGSIARAWLGSVADAFARSHDGPVLLVRPRESEEDRAPQGRADLLVPLDGSKLSERALEHAVELGELCHSTFHLTRVVPNLPGFVSPYLPETVQAIDESVGQAREDAARYLEDVANGLRRRGFQVTTSVVVDTQPGHAILTEATEVGADFIVMATHGYRGLRRALLGSTADKVVRGSELPLLLYRPPDPPSSAASESNKSTPYAASRTPEIT